MLETYTGTEDISLPDISSSYIRSGRDFCGNRRVKTSKETQCIAANAKMSLVITYERRSRLEDSSCSNSVEEIQNIRQRRVKRRLSQSG